MKLMSRSIQHNHPFHPNFPLGGAMSVRWTLIPENFGISKREKLSSATICLIKWVNYIPKCSLPSGLSDEPFGEPLAPPHGEPESTDGGSVAIFGRKIDISPPSVIPSAAVWPVKRCHWVSHSSPSLEVQIAPPYDQPPPTPGRPAGENGRERPIKIGVSRPISTARAPG